MIALRAPRLLARIAFATAVTTLVISGTSVLAQRRVNPVVARRQARLEAELTQRRARYGQDAGTLLFPGILADRRTGTVRVTAEATGIASDDPMEHLVIAAGGGKDYEAFAFSLARPSHVHRALRFVGLKPGHPSRQVRGVPTWPKGPRVVAHVEWEAQQDGRTVTRRVRLEQLVLDKSTGDIMPLDDGFVFTGSEVVEHPDQPTNTVYSADVFEPKAVISSYNESAAVLSPARLAPQSVVYQSQILNPLYTHEFPEARPLHLVLTRQNRDPNFSRVRELAVHIAPGPDEPARQSHQLRYSLAHGALQNHGADPPEATATDGETDRVQWKPRPEPVFRYGEPAVLDEAGFLARLARLLEDGHDPFLQVTFDDRLLLLAAQHVSVLLEQIEGPNAVRTTPPNVGQLHFRAFMPDERWADPARRVVHPWELRLAATPEGNVSGSLRFYRTQWTDDGQSTVTAEDRTVADGEELARAVQSERPGMAAMVVFADPMLTYGTLRTFISPAMQHYPTVFIFVEME